MFVSFSSSKVHTWTWLRFFLCIIVSHSTVHTIQVTSQELVMHWLAPLGPYHADFIRGIGNFPVVTDPQLITVSPTVSSVTFMHSQWAPNSLFSTTVIPVFVLLYIKIIPRGFMQCFLQDFMYWKRSALRFWNIPIYFTQKFIIFSFVKRAELKSVSYQFRNCLKTHFIIYVSLMMSKEKLNQQ